MPPLFRRLSTRSTASEDRLRERQLERVKQLAERFVYDLGLLMAGHDPALDGYVDGAVASRLRAALEPFRASGDTMRPNFGEYGELRVHGELLAADPPLRCEIEFEDRSLRETADGRLLPSTRSRMRVTLTLGHGLQRIADVSIDRIATPTPA